eukprot:TRINITY_DN629_c0_g1_i1.p1 TRINITY_DN629_c0_g1~~TRINITY_DN629_c0_g1_i1.p1  ORF type:complete len:317 (+),score=32.46 TRINITY_DN629_c0_g1_i1:81-953(+)
MASVPAAAYDLQPRAQGSSQDAYKSVSACICSGKDLDLSCSRLGGMGAEEAANVAESGSGAGSRFDCNICLQTANDPVVTMCGHLFCWRCMYKWMVRTTSVSTKCPVCSAEVSEKSVVPLYGRGSGLSEASKGTGEQESTSNDCTETIQPGESLPKRPKAQRPEPKRQATLEPGLSERAFTFSTYPFVVPLQFGNVVMLGDINPFTAVWNFPLSEAAMASGAAGLNEPLQADFLSQRSPFPFVAEARNYSHSEVHHQQQQMREEEQQSQDAKLINILRILILLLLVFLLM